MLGNKDSRLLNREKRKLEKSTECILLLILKIGSFFSKYLVRYTEKVINLLSTCDVNYRLCGINWTDCSCESKMVKVNQDLLAKPENKHRVYNKFTEEFKLNTK